MSELIDHTDSEKLQNDVKDGKLNTIACNVLVLWQKVLEKFELIDDIQKTLEIMNERLTTLEGLI